LVFERRDICESEPHQIWDLQRARLRYVPESASADVIVVRGIGKFADSTLSSTIQKILSKSLTDNPRGPGYGEL